MRTMIEPLRSIAKTSNHRSGATGAAERGLVGRQHRRAVAEAGQVGPARRHRHVVQGEEPAEVDLGRSRCP